MGGTSPGALPLLQMIIALAAVLAVILVLAWTARRVQRGGRGATRLLRTHATLSLGTRERAVLVEAGGQFLLLGVAAGQVRLLHRFDTAPEVPPRTDDAVGGDFLSQLRQALGNRK